MVRREGYFFLWRAKGPAFVHSRMYKSAQKPCFWHARVNSVQDDDPFLYEPISQEQSFSGRSKQVYGEEIGAIVTFASGEEDFGGGGSRT